MKFSNLCRKIIVLFIIFSIVFPCIFIKISNASTVAPRTYTEDINTLNEESYPGYKKLIEDLKAKHPNYKFVLYYTGLNWDEVINAEYQSHGISPLNLFQVKDNYEGLWYCPICGTTRFDNGSLCCASKDAIEYMMDPRNSLNDSDLFQFKSLEGTDVTIEEIRNVVSSNGSFINNEEAIQAIYDASVTYNINAYFLVAKIINEHGKNGSTLTAGKGYNGEYKNCYNYFNVGSYGNGSDAIIKNGLETAQTKKWNTIRASILGGAEIVKNNYIVTRGQKTLYFQKFDVTYQEALFSYQYQANIMAAQSQGESLKKYYGEKANEIEMVFIIPVYEKITKEVSERPSIYKTNTINYENGIVTNVSSSLTVRASASKNGLAIGKLNNGEPIKILSRATEQVDNFYWDLIVSKVDGTFGYAARVVGGDLCITSLGTREISSGAVATKIEPVVVPEPNTDEVDEEIEEKAQILIEENNVLINPITTVDDVKKQYENVLVYNSKEELIEEGKIGTGYIIKIDDVKYTVVKKGDVNGDCKVNITDAISILNYIKDNESIKEECKIEAAKILNSKKVSVSDVIYLLNYIKGDSKIEIKKDNIEAE